MDTLGKDSASIAIILMALGQTPEKAFAVGVVVQRILAGRSYDDRLTVEDLRGIVLALGDGVP